MICSHQTMLDRSDTYCFGFNCYGFALNNLEWLQLRAFNKFNKDYFKTYSTEELQETLEKCTKELLKRFSTLRVIQKEQDVKINEYIIALRIGSTDFHFMKKVGRYWYQKRGGQEVEKITKKNVFDKNGWSGRKYNSNIVLFARRL